MVRTRTSRPPQKNSEAETTVTMRGKPDSVIKGMQEVGQGDPGKNEQKFAELLRSPAVEVIAERVLPETLDGQPLKKSYTVNTPTNILKIRQEIEKKYGGHRWFIGVYNEDGDKIGGTQIEITVPPKPVFSNDDSSGVQHTFGDQPLQTEQQPDDPAAVLKERLRIKQYREALGEDGNKTAELMRTMQENTNRMIETMRTQFAEQLRQVQDDKKEQKYLSIIEDMKKQMADMGKQNQQQNEMTALKASLEKQNEQFMAALKDTKEKDGANQNTSMMMEMFKTINESQNKMFENIAKTQADQNKNNSQRFEELLKVVTSKSDTLESTNKVMEMFGSMSDLFGMRPGGDAPKDWQTRLIDALESTAPKVLEYVEKRKAEGKEITEAGIKEYMTETANQVTENLQGHIQDTVKEQYNEKHPAPTVQIPAKAAVTNQTNKENQSVQNNKEIHDNIKNRVNAVLQQLNGELDIMPADAQWVRLALNHLPAEMLNKLAAVKDEKELIPIFQGFAAPGTLGGIGMKITLSGKKKKWLQEQFAMMVVAIKEGLRQQTEESQPTPETPATPPTPPVPPAQPESTERKGDQA